MFMRVALAVHGRDIGRVIETYDLMSTRYFIHASPTLFHAGMPDAQLSSCFLLQMDATDVEYVFKGISDCAVISNHAGGIGLGINNITASG